MEEPKALFDTSKGKDHDVGQRS